VDGALSAGAASAGASPQIMAKATPPTGFARDDKEDLSMSWPFGRLVLNRDPLHALARTRTHCPRKSPGRTDL
jgi:hypothetical protein